MASPNPAVDLLRELLKQVPKEQLKDIYKEAQKIAGWKISAFTPHPKQDEFFRSGAKIRLFQGGNRSGKSTAGCLEAISQSLGMRTWYPSDDPARFVGHRPPTRGRIVCEDFQATAKNIIVPKLFEWIPADFIKKIKKNAVGVETDWELANGSRFNIMTNEQDDDLFEGWDGDWVWYDEPPRRAVFIACQRGLVDRGGKAWLTMTPLKEPWIYDELFLKSHKGSGIEVFLVDIEDNVGFGLSKDNVDDFASLLSEEEKQMRLRGRFHQLSGLVYKEFNPSIHVIPPFPIPANWPRWRSIDPHPRTPHMVLWMTCSPQGDKYVYDELFHACLISELCQMIRAKTATDKIVKTICDPLAFQENPLNGRTWADEFRQHGVPVIQAPKALSQGIMAVKNELVGINNKPGLYVFNSCERTIWEFGRYQWDDWRGNSKENRSLKERPKDKDDHAMECLYRLLLQDIKWRDMDHDFAPIEYPERDVW